jgi:large subunit ribosomal protein L29
VKSTDRLNKLKDLSDEELEDRQQEFAEESFRLRFQWTMGQSEALKKMREVRKDQARVLTLLREREIRRELGA